MVKNKCVVVSNYATSELDRVLNTMGEDGYSWCLFYIICFSGTNKIK